MSKIENTSRKSPFFTENRTKPVKEKPNSFVNDDLSGYKVKDSQTDAKVSIPEATKMFSQIKKAADAVPNQDNSKKINALKAKIEKGEYDIDENKLAETISRKEFQIWSE